MQLRSAAQTESTYEVLTLYFQMFPTDSSRQPALRLRL